jgi:hypothetical protein
MNNYFTLHEFLYSSAALEKKIDNWPTDFWVIENIQNKLLPVLNKLREAWGGPIRITSGYRSEALNRAVGGVKNSIHLKGLAADLVPAGGNFEYFKAFVPIFFSDNPFDQLILEKSGSSQWVHLGIESNEGKCRKQIFGLDKTPY